MLYRADKQIPLPDYCILTAAASSCQNTWTAAASYWMQLLFNWQFSAPKNVQRKGATRAIHGANFAQRMATFIQPPHLRTGTQQYIEFLLLGSNTHYIYKNTFRIYTERVQHSHGARFHKLLRPLLNRTGKAYVAKSYTVCVNSTSAHRKKKSSLSDV